MFKICNSDPRYVAAEFVSDVAESVAQLRGTEDFSGDDVQRILLDALALATANRFKDWHSNSREPEGFAAKLDDLSRLARETLSEVVASFIAAAEGDH